MKKTKKSLKIKNEFISYIINNLKYLDKMKKVVKIKERFFKLFN